VRPWEAAAVETVPDAVTILAVKMEKATAKAKEEAEQLKKEKAAAKAKAAPTAKAAGPGHGVP
jgi:hypothetical protein